MSSKKNEIETPRSPVEGVGIGLGLAAGAVIVFLALPILLDASPSWRLASFVAGSILGSIGLGGALMDYSRVRGNEAYNDWGVSLILVATGVTLLGFHQSKDIRGFASAVLIVFALSMILFGVIGIGMGASKFAGQPVSGTPSTQQGGRSHPTTPTSGSAGTPGRGSRMSRYEVLTLAMAAAGILVNLIAVFLSK